MNMKRIFISLFTVLFLSLSFGKANADIDAWPLLEVSDDTTTVLYPLHVREDDFEMNFPFYYKTNEGRDIHYLWPLIKLRDGRLVRVAPIYFGEDKDNYTILPLMHRKDGKTWWLIPPMFLGKNTKVIFPVYYERNDLNYHRKHLLLYYKVDTPTYHSTGVFPFYMKSTEEHIVESPPTSSFFVDPVPATGTITSKTNTLWPLFYKKDVRNLDGDIIKKTRRFIFLQDDRYENGSRKLSFLGIVFREKIK